MSENHLNMKELQKRFEKLKASISHEEALAKKSPSKNKHNKNTKNTCYFIK